MKLLFLLLIIIGITAGCTKENICEDQYTTMRYLQTQCADPWQNDTSNVTTLSNVSAYLLSNGLFVASLSIQRDAPAQVCLACHCKTGNTIYVTTLNDSTTISKFNQLGFIY